MASKDATRGRRASRSGGTPHSPLNTHPLSTAAHLSASTSTTDSSFMSMMCETLRSKKHRETTSNGGNHTTQSGSTSTHPKQG